MIDLIFESFSAKVMKLATNISFGFELFNRAFSDASLFLILHQNDQTCIVVTYIQDLMVLTNHHG